MLDKWTSLAPRALFKRGYISRVKKGLNPFNDLPPFACQTVFCSKRRAHRGVDAAGAGHSGDRTATSQTVSNSVTTFPTPGAKSGGPTITQAESASIVLSL